MSEIKKDWGTKELPQEALESSIFRGLKEELNDWEELAETPKQREGVNKIKQEVVEKIKILFKYFSKNAEQNTVPAILSAEAKLAQTGAVWLNECNVYPDTLKVRIFKAIGVVARGKIKEVLGEVIEGMIAA